jgi:hypothetical protein
MTIEDQMRTFIEAVLGSMTGNAVMGLRDRPGPKGKVNRYTDFKYPEQLDQMVKFAEQHRNEDLYLSPLIYGEERDPESLRVRRTPENALFSQTIYQDSDTCPPDKFRVRPSIHVTSSTGRYQDFWQLVEPIPAAEAATISHKVATAHRDDGSDPSSWSANKVLRIPHSQNTSHGFPEDVKVQYSGDVYDALDIAGAYDDVELTERPIIRLPADVSYESEQDLPDYADALDKLPEGFQLEILTKENPEGVDRSRLRYRLLCDLFRTGTLTFEDVLSLAWHAPVSRKWKEDSRNIRGLIAEALKAQGEVAYESGAGLDAPDESEIVPKLTGTSFPSLLTDEERDSISGDENWMKRWCEWNQSKLGRAYNPPYVRLNGWMSLSAAFCDLGYIPQSNGPEYLNLFGMSVGDSGSGKSSSLKVWRTFQNELFPEDKSWDLGGNASPNALHEKLLERDGKVSSFNTDEAHGWFKQILGQQWAEGILEAIAKYYDGFVPPMLRTGNRDLSGKSAKTFFLMHLFGTKIGEMSITRVLTKSMILSGFLARFIWSIGEPRILSEESFMQTQSNGEYVAMGYEPMARQWAAEFNDTKKRLRGKHKKTMIPMMMDREALIRLSKCGWQLVQMYKDHPLWELLDPSIIRLPANIRRAATLLALEEGCDTVSLRHTLLAIEASEEWLNGILYMTESISDSEWKRLCDEVFAFVNSRGNRVGLEVVNRKFASRKPRDLQEQIGALISQGLIYEKTEGGKRWLYINGS